MKEQSERRPRQPLLIEQAALLGAIASIVSILGSLARSKVTAVVLGPEGVGLSAQILQVSNLAFLPLAMLTGPALLRRLTGSRTSADVDHRATIGTATWTIAGLTLLYLPVLFALSSSVLPDAPEELGARVLLLLSVVTAGLAKVTEVFRQALVARGALTALTYSTTVATAIFSICAISGTLMGDLTGQYIAVTVATALAVVVYARSATQNGVALPGWPSAPSDKSLFTEAFTVGLASLFAGLALQVALIAIRIGMDRAHGTAAVGQFQAAWVIGVQYFGLILTGVRQHAFPRYATARDSVELERELHTAASFVLRWAPPALLLCIALRDWIIRALYTSEFYVSADILGYQLAGDIPKALSWTLDAALIYRADLVGFAVTQTAGAITLPVFVLAAVWLWGPTGAGLGYTAAFSVQLLLTTLTLRYRMKVRVQRAQVGLALGWMLLALGANEAVSQVPFLALPVALLSFAAVLPGLLRSGKGRQLTALLRRFFRA